MQIVKQAGPFAAMVVGYVALLYAYSQGWGELVPQEARIPLWLMAPALAGVLSLLGRKDNA